MFKKKDLILNKIAFLESCKKRNYIPDFDYFEKNYQYWLELSSKYDSLRNLQKNTKEISKAKELKIELKNIEEEFNKIDLLLEEWNQNQPNILLNEVPYGKSENDNEVIFVSFHELKQINLTHDKIIENLVMFKEAAEISGSRFIVLKNELSELKNALVNFLLNENKKEGYLEYSIPYLVNQESFFGTGQFPKFKEEAFSTQNDKWLISTGEISLVNIWRNYVFNEEELPILCTTYSPCFRKEAGSAGKDLKGLIRLHQFHKVELVTICKLEDAEFYHNKQLKTATKILDLLNLPYRILLHCGADTGFTATKQYDIEVWMPGMNKYLEIASCSQCGNFQSIRSNIKYKKDNKNEYCATLNGSSLPIERLIAAIVENYYDNENKIINIPEALHNYCKINKILL